MSLASLASTTLNADTQRKISNRVMSMPKGDEDKDRCPSRASHSSLREYYKQRPEMNHKTYSTAGSRADREEDRCPSRASNVSLRDRCPSRASNTSLREQYQPRRNADNTASHGGARAHPEYNNRTTSPSISKENLTVNNSNVRAPSPIVLAKGPSLVHNSTNEPCSIRSSSQDIAYIQPFNDSANLEEAPPPSRGKKKKKKKKEKKNSNKKKQEEEEPKPSSPLKMASSCAPMAASSFAAMGPAESKLSPLNMVTACAPMEASLGGDHGEGANPPPAEPIRRGRSRTRRRTYSEESEDSSTILSFDDAADGDFQHGSLAHEYLSLFCGAMCVTEPSDPPPKERKKQSDTKTKSSSSTMPSGISLSLSKESMSSYLDAFQKTLQLGSDIGTELQNTLNAKLAATQGMPLGPQRGERLQVPNAKQSSVDNVNHTKAIHESPSPNGRRSMKTTTTAPVENTATPNRSSRAPKAAVVAVLQGNANDLAPTYRQFKDVSPAKESDFRHLASF